MDYRRIVLGAFVLLTTFSCIAADGLFRVRGSLVDATGAPADSCILQFHAAGDGTLLRTTNVAGEFETGWTIAPWAHKYYLTVICPRDSLSFKTDVFKTNGTKYATKPMDLGTIVLRRQR